jgi:uncharacterized repeat protein (TIGR03803 family)
VIHNFGSKAGDPSQPVPPGAIAQSRGGAMLSTAPDPDAAGKVFRIYTYGSVQVLHQFNGSDGSLPVSGLTLATDGQYYGTTQTGGKFNFGTIFKMSSGGTVTTLHDFTGGTDGEYPIPVPIESVYGDLYGTTAGDGKTSFGTVYKITREGAPHLVGPQRGEAVQTALNAVQILLPPGVPEHGVRVTVLDSVLDPAEVKVFSTPCVFVFCNLQIPRRLILFESNRRHQDPPILVFQLLDDPRGLEWILYVRALPGLI